MTQYTLDDLTKFLKKKGYVWHGKVWTSGSMPQKVYDAIEIYSKSMPAMFVLYKDKQQILQYISIFDTSLKFWQENFPLEKGKFILEKDFSKEWADFLAQRHNVVL